MALNSPGVEIQVIDESFYTPAAAGTTPLIFVATEANKLKPSSTTETAPGTLAANAGKVYTITSQRDLTDTFGVPVFQTDASNNPVHGGELNEYGLQSAYSFLGVSSRAYVVRADFDLAQLESASSEPVGPPVSGTYWVDTDASAYGISQWDATNSIFVNKTPLVIDNSNSDVLLNTGTTTPLSSISVEGTYAMVVTSDNTNQLYYKNGSSRWVLAGSNQESSFAASNPTASFTSTSWMSSWPVVTSTGFGTITTGSFTINDSTTITVPASSTPAAVATLINTVADTTYVGAKVVNGALALYSDIRANGGTGEIKLANVTSGYLTLLGLTVGTYRGLTLTIASHTGYPDYSTVSTPSGSLYIKTTSKNGGANWVLKLYNGTTKQWGTVAAPLYAGTDYASASLDATGGQNIPVGTVFVETNYEKGTGVSGSPALVEYKLWRRSLTGSTTISSTTAPATLSDDYTFTVYETSPGAAGYTAVAITVNVPPNISITEFVALVNTSGLTYVSASYSNGIFSFSHRLGGDFKIRKGTNDIMVALGFTENTTNLYPLEQYDAAYAAPSGGVPGSWKATNWKPLVYEAQTLSPTTAPEDGQLWYNSNLSEVDVMYHNGSTWIGYLNAFPGTDPKGPIVSATEPDATTGQSDGTALVNGDIWVSTAEADGYGHNVYVWNGSTSKWVMQDVADNSTPNGWLFADARWATSGSATEPSDIADLLSSNYVDPDAPDPALYPRGIRLWNLRRSGYNVKKYVVNHINIEANDGENLRYGNESMSTYNPDRWVSASPNNVDGSGTFGRLAQRGFVVKQLKALVDTSQVIRDTDTLVFNLIACPGYPEAIQNMIALNNDRGQTAFVVGDTPFRLEANGTALQAWGANSNGAVDNNDTGAVSFDEYMAMFYPSGYTNDNVGNPIVVPPSHMMLRTIALSDQKSYQWFAPAGVRRGGVDNATAVGYLKNGEFVRAPLPESLRDVLQGSTVKINPIATLPGSGIVNYGNLTRARAASALDRINVVRLIAYLRRQLEILARPYLFEPNDRITRNEIKNATESLLLELVGQRALYDFLVVCDESNNTNARIDRSELWLDIAIEPVKAVEFIYIPLRIKNTGDIAAGL